MVISSRILIIKPLKCNSFTRSHEKPHLESHFLLLIKIVDLLVLPFNPITMSEREIINEDPLFVEEGLNDFNRDDPLQIIFDEGTLKRIRKKIEDSFRKPKVVPPFEQNDSNTCLP